MRLLLAGFFGALLAATAAGYSAVTPDSRLEFPRDFGSHPGFRTEWWYVTGWLTTTEGESLGFQVTFFRTQPDVDASNPSAFTPRQLLIAHCAISDPKRGRLWQDQKIRRAGLGLADAASNDTNVWMDDWFLKRVKGEYRAGIPAEGFSMNLVMAPTQPVLLNGNQGVSRKGPSPLAASYYYSLPHLAVTGSIERAGLATAVTGEAWLDHEWSSEYLDNQSSGWDWVGLNLADGASLMVFRIRGLNGEQRWAGGTLRDLHGEVHILGDREVRFESVRQWTSPRTGIRYPVEWRIEAAGREWQLRPLLDDQENDTRLTTGAIYWEGAIQVLEHGTATGRGYLELTGYGEQLRLR